MPSDPAPLDPAPIDPAPFDVGELAAWLRREGLLGGRGAVTVTPIGDGHSNLTYEVGDGERRVVVRRPPPLPLPSGANDVLREARILAALAGSAVPVPVVLATAAAGEVMDVPCYAMEHLDGVVSTTALPATLDAPDQRRGVGEALVDALVALHRADWSALADIARPAGFLQRQLDRLPRLLADGHGAVPDEVADLHDQLAAALPATATAARHGTGTDGPGAGGSGVAIIHGDLRLGNVMLARTAPARIIGVLDWELAGVGDPLVDVGYTLATYAVPGEAPHALTAMSKATLRPGFPSRAALAARYGQRTGADVSHLAWYEALALWKLGVLFELRRRRYAAGGADDPYWATPGRAAGLFEAARRALTRLDEPRPERTLR